MNSEVIENPTRKERVFRIISKVSLLLGMGAFPLFAAAENPAKIELAESWKLASAKEAPTDGAAISVAGYKDARWHPIHRMPATVLEILQEDGVYSNLYVGTNMLTVPQDLYQQDWWYRTTFKAPAGGYYTLEFPGINYRAEVWLNGQRIADNKQVVGMYAAHEFNVTPWIKPGSRNVLAVKVTPERLIEDVDGVELADSWYDWINWKYLGFKGRKRVNTGAGVSFVPDRNAGVWKPVYLRVTGTVSVSHALVNSELLPAESTAKLTVFANLRDLSAQPASGTLKGTISRPGKPTIHFEQTVTNLSAGEDREVRFAPEQFPELVVTHPDLWWPYTMGAPALYDLQLEFVRKETLSDNYVRFYLQRGSLDGTQLLQASSVERMETTETLPSAKLGKVAGYGLYNDATFEGPFVFRGHGGALAGALTDMAYLPGYGRGYAVMINSGNGDAIRQIANLVRHYVIRGLKPPAMPHAAAVPIELRRHYGGYYQAISPRSQWLYGFERLIHVERLAFTGDRLSTSFSGPGPQRWVPVSDRLFRKEDQSVATLALLPDAAGEILIQAGWTTFKKVSPLQFWAQIVGVVLVSVLTVSSLLRAPVWVFRKLLGKHPNSGPMAIRVLPFLSAVLLVLFDGLLVVSLFGTLSGSVTDVSGLGVPSLLTVSIMLTSIAFPLAAVASLFIVIRKRHAPMNRITYWHSVFIAAAMAAVALYYGYWGLIGLRLWV